MEVLIRNRQRAIKINLRRIKKDSLKLLKSFTLSNAELGISLVNDERMRRVNRAYRNIDKTTDVLSFPQIDGGGASNRKKSSRDKLSTPGDRYPAMPLGDIVINLQAAKRQSLEYGLSLHGEVRRLIIHGFLHLLGFDHEKSRYNRKKMEKLERELGDALEALD